MLHLLQFMDDVFIFFQLNNLIFWGSLSIWPTINVQLTYHLRDGEPTGYHALVLSRISAVVKHSVTYMYWLVHNH